MNLSTIGVDMILVKDILQGAKCKDSSTIIFLSKMLIRSIETSFMNILLQMLIQTSLIKSRKRMLTSFSAQ